MNYRLDALCERMWLFQDMQGEYGWKHCSPTTGTPFASGCCGGCCMTTPRRPRRSSPWPSSCGLGLLVTLDEVMILAGGPGELAG
jgi:hypothetical protein